MATSGGGKSTLVRSLLLDIVKHNEKMNGLVWLSEETEDDFTMELHKTGYDSEKMDDIHIVSEMNAEATVDINYLKHHIQDKKPRFILLDNLTTSAFYMDKGFEHQAKIAVDLKKIADDFKIPIIVFCHVGAAVNDNISRTIAPNDIRGSKTIVNLAPFFYIMQRFVAEDTIIPTIKIIKHRGQDIRFSIFGLAYSRERSIYFMDEQINFEKFKEAFKKRNVL